jgi:hypothetical protein
MSSNSFRREMDNMSDFSKKPKAVLKCSNCGAVYRYQIDLAIPSQILTCQNCGRLMHVDTEEIRPVVEFAKEKHLPSDFSGCDLSGCDYPFLCCMLLLNVFFIAPSMVRGLAELPLWHEWNLGLSLLLSFALTGIAVILFDLVFMRDAKNRRRGFVYRRYMKS